MFNLFHSFIYIENEYIPLKNNIKTHLIQQTIKYLFGKKKKEQIEK